MGNVLGIVGECYFRGYIGKLYPAYCRKEKGNCCWEAFKRGKEDKKKGKECQIQEPFLTKYKVKYKIK